MTARTEQVIMEKEAAIHRMVTPDHLCPWGIKALDILRREGFRIEDHHLESQEANQQYKKDHGYDETPQVWIEGEHVGGYDALREHFGMSPDPKDGETYQPVVTVFAVALGMALSTCWAIQGGLSIVRYSHVYPFVEGGAGIVMIAGLFTWVAAPLALIVSVIGAVSVFKAVYLEKRDLNCACVGGGSSVPLGFISLTENLMMIAMAIWMMAKAV